MACGILVPWLGIEAVPFAVKVWNPNCCIAREFPQWSSYCLYTNYFIIYFYDISGPQKKQHFACFLCSSLLITSSCGICLPSHVQLLPQSLFF